MQFHLIAYTTALYDAWNDAFAEYPDVKISQGDILTFQADAIVSPANSFGYMDGGLDLKYSQFFGWELEQRLRKLLLTEHYGELPIGQAVIVETGHPAIRYLISAPPMRVPMNVAATVNAYLAFRAVIQATKAFNQTARAPITSILCPGLATGEGRMPPERCAYQMAQAYRICVLGELEAMGGLAGAVQGHLELLK
jgi:O-acetyl-ADP-ribose deacetylase (regulator of RNase III)